MPARIIGGIGSIWARENQWAAIQIKRHYPARRSSGHKPCDFWRVLRPRVAHAAGLLGVALTNFLEGSVSSPAPIGAPASASSSFSPWASRFPGNVSKASPAERGHRAKSSPGAGWRNHPCRPVASSRGRSCVQAWACLAGRYRPNCVWPQACTPQQHRGMRPPRLHHQQGGSHVRSQLQHNRSPFRSRRLITGLGDCACDFDASQISNTTALQALFPRVIPCPVRRQQIV